MSGIPPEQMAYWTAHKDDDKRPNLIAAVAICLFFSYTAVVLRLGCRKQMHVPLLVDDWLIVAALVSIDGRRPISTLTERQIPLTAMHVSVAVAASCGFGLHLPFASNLPGFAKSILSVETNYSVAIVLTKLSILALYRRIFPFTAVTICGIIIGIIVMLYNAALIVVAFTSCVPLKKRWDPSLPGWCMNTSIPFTTLA